MVPRQLAIPLKTAKNHGLCWKRLRHRNMRLAWNPLTENARSGTLMIKTMTTATSRIVDGVNAALYHDATMGEPGGKPDGARSGAEAGEMERKVDAVGSIKRHEK